MKLLRPGIWSHRCPGTSPELRGDSGVLASPFTWARLMEGGNLLHPSPLPSGFRASLEMSCPWLEAEQSFEPSMLPGALGNLPPSAFFSLAGATLACTSQARLDGTDKQEGWIRVVYSLSNSLKKAKNKTQTFLVINVKSFPDEVCSQEKRAGYTSHPGEDVLPGGVGVPTSPSAPAHAAGSSPSPSRRSPPAAPQPQPQATPTQDTVFTDHRFPRHDTPPPQSTDLELQGQK